MDDISTPSAPSASVWLGNLKHFSCSWSDNGDGDGDDGGANFETDMSQNYTTLHVTKAKKTDFVIFLLKCIL